MTSIILTKSKRLEELYEKTLCEIKGLIWVWQDYDSESNMTVLLSCITRYYENRRMITHRYSGSQCTICTRRKEGKIRTKRLLKENFKLRQEIAELKNKWWKFW